MEELEIVAPLKIKDLEAHICYELPIKYKVLGFDMKVSLSRTLTRKIIKCFEKKFKKFDKSIKLDGKIELEGDNAYVNIWVVGRSNGNINAEDIVKLIGKPEPCNAKRKRKKNCRKVSKAFH